VFQWSAPPCARKPPASRQPIPAAAGAPSTSSSSATVDIGDTSGGGELPATNIPPSDHDYVVQPQSLEERLNVAQDHIVQLEQELSASRISRFGWSGTMLITQQRLVVERHVIKKNTS